jgi:Ribbon-helix-helix protein, copG family
VDPLASLIVTTPFISLGGVVATDSTQAEVNIGSRVSLDFADRVRQAAEAQDRSVSALIRTALRREIERTDPDTPAA